MKIRKGFTLIEILVVIAIITFVISFGILIDVGTVKKDYFSAEESTIVSALEKARSRSMANLYQSAYGFCYIGSPNYVYVIFNDGSCDQSSTDEIIKANSNITVTLTPSSPITFAQLSGSTLDASIHLTDGTKSADITINNEGTIIW
jgi:prepilin-type N-terminal cleavage/methylation domain-containing protein